MCLHQLGRAKRDGHACSCGAATAAAGACSKVCAGVCCVFADTPRALPSIAELKEVDTHAAAELMRRLLGHAERYVRLFIVGCALCLR